MLLLCAWGVLRLLSFGFCFCFLAHAVASDISLGLNSGFSSVGSLTSKGTGLQSWAELWLISAPQRPQGIGWSAEISAGYQTCECGFVYGYYVRRPNRPLAITGFSKKPGWLLKSLS
jgi:hypothetical protein